MSLYIRDIFRLSTTSADSYLKQHRGDTTIYDFGVGTLA